MARSRDLDPRDESYDDEDDRPRRRPRADSDSGNVAVKIVAILGVVFLGLALICGGTAAVVWYAVNRTVASVGQNMQQFVKEAGRWQEAQEAAEAFLRALRQNDFDRAYQATSKAYRERTSRKALEEYVAQRPAIRSLNAMLMPQGPGFGSKRVTFTFTDAAAGRLVNVRLVVVDEDGSWKIDDLEAD